MYGYPSQTVQETIDSLEMVRQLFEIGIVQSGFWHQFALTTHSPIGKNPDDYGIEPDYKKITFANNDIQFTDQTKIDHNKFSFGLKKSLFNFMHGIGFDVPLQDWFDFKIPRTTISQNYIENCLNSELITIAKPSVKPVWLGTKPQINYYTKSKRGETWEMIQIVVHDKRECIEISMDRKQGQWFVEQLDKMSIYSSNNSTIAELKSDFEAKFDDFELFWYSKQINQLREAGLMVL
jgi:hypothetical protein